MLFSSVALGHGGGIDSMGGHRNNAEGNYHLHSGPLAGNTYSSKEAAEAALDALNNPPPDTTPPQTTMMWAKNSDEIAGLIYDWIEARIIQNKPFEPKPRKEDNE